MHRDPEISFSFLVPDKFIRPGVVLRDNIDMRGVGGMMEVLDEFGNYISCDWVKLPEFERHKIEDGRGDVLRDQVLKMNQNDVQSGYRIVDQRRIKNGEKGIPDLYYVMMEHDSFYHNDPNTHFQKQLSGIESGTGAGAGRGTGGQLKPSNSDVMARASFIHPDGKHLFVLTTKYPNTMINYDLVRSEMFRLGMNEQQVANKLGGSLSGATDKDGGGGDDDARMTPEQRNNVRLFREMTQNATSDRTRISNMLANELLSIYLTNFSEGPTTTAAEAATTATTSTENNENKK